MNKKKFAVIAFAVLLIFSLSSTAFAADPALAVSRVSADDDLDEIEIRFSTGFYPSSVSKSDFKINGESLKSSDKLDIDADDREITIKRRGGFVSKPGQTIKLGVSGIKGKDKQYMKAYKKTVRFGKDTAGSSALRVVKVETDDRDEIEIKFNQTFDASSVKKANITVDGVALTKNDRLDVDVNDREITIERRGNFVSKYGQSVKLVISGVTDANGNAMAKYSNTVQFYDD